MHTCPECNRAMRRDTSKGHVNFICHCGFQEVGTPEDARIGGDVLNAGETEEMFLRVIRNAAHDRVNMKVLRGCPECGLDYTTQIRVGEREVVIWVCSCGYDSSAAA
jgi:ribosomal protein L37AE/L43A